MATKQPINAFVALLEKMEYFDKEYGDDFIWLSGRIGDQACSVQLNISGARAMWDKEFYGPSEAPKEAGTPEVKE